MLNASLKAHDPGEMKCKITVIIQSVSRDRLFFQSVIAKQARFCSKIFQIINTFQMKEYLTQSFSYIHNMTINHR